MAEEVLKQLEEQLNCSICLDTYTDPKLLQCFHVYCRNCLVPLVDRDQQEQLGLTCPTCRQVTSIPDRGVSGLQSAFHINRFLEIRESLQKPAMAFKGAEALTNVVNPTKRNNNCLFHEGKEVELYCETCGELICTRCALKGGQHYDHDYKELKQAFEKYKVEITSLLAPMEMQVTTVNKSLVQLDLRCREISDQRAATARKVHTTFRQIREVLDIRETELIGRLDQMTQSKLKSLAAQRDQIETTLAQLNSCLSFMKESLKTGSERDVLTMKINAVNHARELTIPLSPSTLAPNVKADIAFSTSVDVTGACQEHGHVYTPGLMDPFKSYIESKASDSGTAVVGEKFTTVLQAICFDGKPYEEPVDSLECDVLSEITGAEGSCDVERIGHGRYKVTYQPTAKGNHRLQVRVQGQHVKGSPFGIAARSSPEKLGTFIRSIDVLEEPWGITISPKGEIVVTNYQRCVSVFTSNGAKCQSIGTRGSGKGQFMYPRGVAVDVEGNIFVVDGEDGRIQ
jgi:hypothetical protein